MTFRAGETSVRLIILVRDDSIVEDTEYFNLTIDPSSVPSSVSVGDPCQTILTIVDDDSE